MGSKVFGVLAKHTLALLFILLAIPAVAVAQIDVWIDPGHGGGDPGNLGFSGDPDAYEKVLTLEVSGVLGSRLGQIGFSSLKTRNSGDNYPDLFQRAEMADGFEPNDLGEQEPGQMFISVHMNAGKASVFGTETFYPPFKIFSFDLTAFRVDSTFAATIHTNMMTGANAAFLGCNNDRHVKAGGHIVTTRARVPSVLVEVCFTTNQCQQTKIEQQGNQALIANGIAAGISNLIVPGGRLASASYTMRSVANAASTTGMGLEDGQTATPALPQPRAQPAAGITQSISEGFESPTFPPTGWSTQTAGQPLPHNWHRKEDPLYVRGGVAAARVGPQSANAVDEWLISPAVTLGGGDSGLRFFWNGNRTHALSVNATCSVRQVGAGQWTEVWSLQSEPAGTEFRYQERVVDLTPWAGMQIEFAFRVYGTNGAEFVIDDVSTGTYLLTGPPSNDKCGGAIPVSGGTHVFSGTTCYAANDLNGVAMLESCGTDPLNAPEVFFWMSAAAGDTLNATVTGPWSPVLYLVNTCNQAAGSCVGASPTLQDGDVSTATLQYVFPNAGVYFLVLDGIVGQCGEYELTTQIRDEVTGVETGSDRQGPKPSLAAYPNPSSRLVRFAGERLSVAESNGRLRVYTVAGRLVYEQEVQLSGSQISVDWDPRSMTGTRLPSGVYVATIRAGSELITTRFVLTR